jgi:hypothetical protein
MTNPRVAVYISNYKGMLTNQQEWSLNKTKQALQDSNVAFIYGRYKKWFDLSSFDFQSDDENELTRRYVACIFRTCNRLHKGVLYNCAHHYVGERLGYFSTDRDTRSIHEFTSEELAEALDVFKEKPFVDACRYCQMPFNAPMIIAGESGGSNE